MTLQDLTKNKERIIKKINYQITCATKKNILDVMNKIVAIMGTDNLEKPTMANIDKLTMKAINYYIKFDKVNTEYQNIAIDNALMIKKSESLQSSLR